MTDQPDPAQAADLEAVRLRAAAYSPADVMAGARAVWKLPDAAVSTGCVRRTAAHVSDAIENAARIQFKDVPALLADMAALRAQRDGLAQQLDFVAARARAAYGELEEGRWGHASTQVAQIIESATAVGAGD